MKKLAMEKLEDVIEDKRILIYLKDDDYAKYEIEEYLGDLIRQHGTVVRKSAELRNLRPLGLFKDMEIVKVSVGGYMHKDLLLNLIKNTKDRYFMIEIKEEDDLRKISKVVRGMENNTEIKVFDILDYEEELVWLEKKITEWAGQNKVKRGFVTQLKYYLKNNHSYWNDAKLMCEIEKELDEDVMDNYFEDFEYFSVREQIRNIVLGNKKLKTFQVMGYLLNKKGYEPYYIVDKLLEDIEYMLEVYSLYDKGIIYGGMIHLKQMDSRANKMGVKISEKISTDSIDLKSLIETISILDEEYVREVYRKVVKLYSKYGLKYMIKEEDVISLIEEIRLMKTKEENDKINTHIFQSRKSNKIRII